MLKMPYETFYSSDLNEQEWQAALQDSRPLYLIVEHDLSVSQEWLKLPAVTDHIRMVQDRIMHPDAIEHGDLVTGFHTDENIHTLSVFQEVLEALNWDDITINLDLWLYRHPYLQLLATIRSTETEYSWNETVFPIRVEYFDDGTLEKRLESLKDDEDEIAGYTKYLEDRYSSSEIEDSDDE